jgi:DnaA family protein
MCASACASSNNMAAQLILPMGVDDRLGFDNFIDSPNKKLLAFLKMQLKQRSAGRVSSYEGVFIWGEPDSGKSHLLAALAQWVKQNDGKTVWLDAERGWMPRSGNGLNRVYLLDDVEGFTRDAAAERDFLTLIERIKQQNSMLLITAGMPVKSLKVGLPDLSSRLQAMECFELLALSEKDKREVLRQRASQRGILLSDEVLNWLFTHTARELGALLDLLERIDVQSLSQKRKVTIPLIKSILEEA